MVYDWRHDDDEPDDCRARMLAIWVLTALGAFAGGLALGFAIDWVQGRIL